MGYTELFNHALRNGYLITDATKVYDKFGIRDYVSNEKAWAVDAIWDTDLQTVTVYKDGKEDVIIYIGEMP